MYNAKRMNKEILSMYIEISFYKGLEEWIKSNIIFFVHCTRNPSFYRYGYSKKYLWILISSCGNNEYIFSHTSLLSKRNQDYKIDSSYKLYVPENTCTKRKRFFKRRTYF